MKLYRIRYKEAFAVRVEPEEVYWTPDIELATTPKIYIKKGVPVEHCEMIAAGWAQKRVEVPAHDKEIQTTKPAWIEKVPKTIPGYWETRRVIKSAHYETQEVWVPEHEAERLVEVPGYYEQRFVKGAGHYEKQRVVIPGHYETGRFWQEPRPARRLPGKWVYYEYWVETEYTHENVWVEGIEDWVDFWVDATWEMQTVTVPGQYTDQRVWVPEYYGHEKVWVPEELVFEEVHHPESIVTTIIAVPVKVERQRYWQDESVMCWDVPGPDMVIDEAGMPLAQLAEIEEWFAWYQTTQGGQMFIEGAKRYGLIESMKPAEIAVEAYRGYRFVQPDISVRIAPDVIVKFRPSQFEAMMRSSKGIAYLKQHGMYEMARKIQRDALNQGRESLTGAEIAVLVKAGVLAAMIAAAALAVYYTWPSAEFTFKVTYTKWTYVLRYMENFQYANLVGVSPEGRPYYHGCLEWGGPILGEDRSREADKWYFGEAGAWSAWVETGRWMGIQEHRLWYEAEVEYLGMVSRSGANFFTKYDEITDDHVAGHEPGWSLPSGQWEIIEEEWWHERI
jgi:hypothetical protein